MNTQPHAPWLYIGLSLAALYAPAPLVIPKGFAALAYLLYPMLGLGLFVNAHHWASVNDVGCLLILAVLLGLTALTSYGCYLATARFAPVARFAWRLSLLVALLLYSWAQGAMTINQMKLGSIF